MSNHSQAALELAELTARKFCDLYPHERVTPDSYAGRVMAMLLAHGEQAESDALERALAELRAEQSKYEGQSARTVLKLAISRVEKLRGGK